MTKKDHGIKIRELLGFTIYYKFRTFTAVKDEVEIEAPTEEELWDSFHVLNRKVSLAEFKILLKQLHDSDFCQYEMDRGTSRFAENRHYGIKAHNGLLYYFKYVPREETTNQ